MDQTPRAGLTGDIVGRGVSAAPEEELPRHARAAAGGAEPGGGNEAGARLEVRAGLERSLEGGLIM